MSERTISAKCMGCSEISLVNPDEVPEGEMPTCGSCGDIMLPDTSDDGGGDLIDDHENAL